MSRRIARKVSSLIWVALNEVVTVVGEDYLREAKVRRRQVLVRDSQRL